MKKGIKIVLLIILIIGVLILIFPKSPTGKVIGPLKPSNPSELQEPEDFEKKFVTKVIDGDTVIIEGGEHVRLLGMDTDERGYPCYNPAKKRIEELILGKEVKLEKDQTDKDRYDRLLRYIFLDGKNINAQLVEEGFAVARFYDDVKYKEEINEAERQAILNKVGCKWGEQEGTEIEPPKPKDEPKINNQDNKDNLDYNCDFNDYNCGDFTTHAQAQKVFEACGGIDSDVHALDRDKDGLACETLD